MKKHTNAGGSDISDAIGQFEDPNPPTAAGANPGGPDYKKLIERAITDEVITLHGDEGAREKVLAEVEQGMGDAFDLATFDAAWAEVEPRLTFTEHSRSPRWSTRRLALKAPGAVDVTSPPELRLALACALWADLATLAKANEEHDLRGDHYTSGSEEDRLRAEVLALTAGVDMSEALTSLRGSATLRKLATESIEARGLPVVDAHGFGEGWQTMGTVPMVAPGAA